MSRRAAAGPVPGRPGRAEPAVGGGRRAAADLRDRRRAVAGSGLGAGAGVRRTAAGGRPGRRWCSRPASRARSWPGCRSSKLTGLADERCAGAAGLGAGRAAGRAGPRPDRRGDAGQPAGAAGAAARADARGAGGRVRAARRGAAGRAGSRTASGASSSALPAETRRLLQLAAADPSGDRSLVWRAAGRLGIPVQAAAPAVEAGLVEFGAPGAVPASAGALGGLPVGVVLRQAAGARGAGRGDRPGRPIRIAGPGTGPRPRPGRTRRSPRSWSARPAGRRPAAGWPRPRRSWSARWR